MIPSAAVRAKLVFALLIAMTLDAEARKRPVRRPAELAPMYRTDSGRSASVGRTGLPQSASEHWRKATLQGALSVLSYRQRLHIASSTRPGDRATIVTLSAATGETLWTYRPRGRIATPFAVDGDRLIFGSDDGLYALNVADGSEAWYVASGAVWSAPLVMGGSIYYGETGGTFRALDASTREERWRVTLPGTFPSEAAAWNDLLFVSTGTRMLALSLTSGAERWRVTAASAWMPHTVSGGRLFAGTADQSFQALNATDGSVVWTHHDPPAGFPDWSSPALANDVVIAANRTGDLIAFDVERGEVRWRFHTVDRAAYPVIASGVVYFGITGHGSGTATTPRSFYAVDVATGGQLWSITQPGLLLEGEPAVENGAIYMASVEGFVLALR